MPSPTMELFKRLLKHIAKLAPSIGWKLLSSRLTCKNYTGHTYRSREAREQVLAECIAAFPDALRISSDNSRWLPVDVASFPCPVVGGAVSASPAQKWAAKSVCSMAQQGQQNFKPSVDIAVKLQVLSGEGLPVQQQGSRLDIPGFRVHKA